MTKREPRTRVRFLVYPNEQKTVFAYFPTLWAKHDYENSMHVCYEHQGQHGSCSPWFARLCRPATRREASALHAELTAIGYRLKPERIKRYPQHPRGWAFA